MKKLIPILLGLLLLAGCAGGAKDEDTFDALMEKGEIIVGLDDTFVPMGFRNPQGELVGFDVDLAREIFTRIGLTPKFQPIDWSLKESELNSGNIDVIFNGYTITDARKEKVNFSTPYMENTQIIITLASSDINTKEDLKGKAVSVQKESSAYDAVSKETDIYEYLKNGELITFDSNLDLFLDLEAGRSDAIVLDEVFARYVLLSKNIEDYRILEDNFGEEEYGIGFRKSDKTLLEKTNETLAELIEDGTFDEIKKVYIND
ncbi:amino acid ABC transporter substrate-binding protein [Proteiniclasticum ruminis]|uniref:Polar amino acid transport system substrate-binding protein n=1 Tax=Proteiniclasticum ruminis TaxID=398199 RepID=A0A1G8Q7R8_9CLOT|nr:amino acid ABC transporter substrate-binding protein [Proteiniclasticum ruminis]SDJ00525.1 polar amino acid transport system substrate-binding protein [Proteiniclasticum ruminis]